MGEDVRERRVDLVKMRRLCWISVALACALRPFVVDAANSIDVFPVKSGETYAPGDKVYVMARLNMRQGWFGRVSLFCKVNYGDETNAPMRANGDGTWSGECDTSGMSRGDMLRWRVQSENPFAQGPPGGGYYGTVLTKGLDTGTKLPVLYVFSPDKEAIKTDSGARVSVYFEGNFYDGVFMRRRGSGRSDATTGVALASKDWEKRKFKLDFDARVFRFDAKQRKVEEINLQSHYQEPGEETYMREPLASFIFQKAGVPVALTKYVSLRLNNAPYGLYSMVEQVDSTFLKRNQLDSKGSMYKAVNWKYSNLRKGNSNIPCPYATPDYPERWMVDECPEIWRKTSKADADNWDDLWDLTQTLDRVQNNPRDGHLLFDTLNVPAVVNEMATQALVLNNDRCTKNYYMHFDRGTREWQRIPWDLEDIFPGDRRYGTDTCDPSECSAQSTSYCVMSCEKFNSPLYCDRNHPQDIFAPYENEAQNPKTTYNVLVDVILAVPSTRTMFFTRLRTLMDEILATSVIEDWVWSTRERIRSDALRDSEKWNVGAIRAIDAGIDQLVNQVLPSRRNQLFTQYSWMIPSSTPHNARILVAYASKSPSDTSQAYVKLSNPNGYAVDMSGWILQTRDGQWKFWLKPGTVVDAGWCLFLVRDAARFRERSLSWAKREYPDGVFVQGNFPKDLPTDDTSAFKIYKP